MKKFKKKELEVIWEKVPLDYYEVGSKVNLGQRLWHKEKFSSVKKITAGIFPGKILDVGSNSGFLTAKISRLFPEADTTGTDIYKKSIESAKKKYPHLTFITADAHKLPFKEREFDLIFCLETLEHVISPRKVLKEMKRCLKNEGRIIISMDSGIFLFKVIWYLWTNFGRGKVWQGSHLYKFNRKSLEKMILEEGFVIEKEIISHLGMAVIFKARKDEP